METNFQEVNMKTEMKNAAKFVFPFIAILALVLSTALPVLADNKPKHAPALRPIQGEVISVNSDNSTFVVQSGNQQQATIIVDSNTKFFMVPVGKTAANINGLMAKDKVAEKKANKAESRPPQSAALKDSAITANCDTDPNGLERYGKAAQFSDIQVGDKVIVWLNSTDNLAAKVLIIKAPVIQKVKGTITAVSDSSITITPANGTAVTLTWDANTRFMLKGFISVQTGQYASAVYNRNTMTAQMVDVQAMAPAAEPDQNI
jgi:hypothetical protein